MTAKYDETKGSSYNYEVGYLEGLREASRAILNLDNTIQNQVMSEHLREMCREQMELIEEEFPVE